MFHSGACLLKFLGTILLDLSMPCATIECIDINLSTNKLNVKNYMMLKVGKDI